VWNFGQKSKDGSLSVKQYFLFVLCFCSQSAFAFINVADSVALSAIVSNTAATVSTLHAGLELFEIGEETRAMFSDAEDDSDAIQELFSEIDPQAGSEVYAREASDNNLNRESLFSLDETLWEADSIKWQTRYLQERTNGIDSKRVGSWARLATNGIRLGKRINNLTERSAQDKIAQNSQASLYGQALTNKMLADIRRNLREQRDEQAREKIEGARNNLAMLQVSLHGTVDDRIKRRWLNKKWAEVVQNKGEIEL
jgi:hypothetical protein